MKILALAATNNTESINKELVKYAAGLVPDAEVQLIDLNDFGCPLFSLETEKKTGIPDAAKKFVELVDASDLIMISYAEYNGSYTPVYKNLLDWASRIRKELWGGKPLFFLATSPGGRGAQTVLTLAAQYAPFMGGNVIGTFSLPLFQQNFGDGRITNKKIDQQLKKSLNKIPDLLENKTDKVLVFTEKLRYGWEFFGYGLFAVIVGSGIVGSGLVSSSWSYYLWPLALYAATFTLTIKPLYDLFGGSLLQGMLSWRKGIGFISSGIVVGFWLNRYFDFTDVSLLVNYFSADNWSLDLQNMLTRISEITGWILLLISNKWMIKYANKLWRTLQKLAFPYFLSAATYLYLFLGKEYGLICLLIFFVVYQIWIYAQLSQTEAERQASSARTSQAS